MRRLRARVELRGDCTGETELGRKRAIDQSACNKDFSCVEGFCPSFVTVHGGALRKPSTAHTDTSGGDLAQLAHGLAEPMLPDLSDGYAAVVTGVGGTGVVTISAVLAQAAFQDGLGFGSIDMTGLAQKRWGCCVPHANCTHI